MSKHSKHLTFGVRQYAAAVSLFYADIQERGLTLSELATRQGISKPYAAKLMVGWINAGIAMKASEPYRKNATMTRYYFTSMGRDKFVQRYYPLCEACYHQVVDHVRNERISHIMSI